jgi:hypothetical protein
MKINMKLKSDNNIFKEIMVVILKFVGIFFGLSIILIMVVYSISYIRLISFQPPEKLTNIPEGAVWRGGPDGGFWYFLSSKKDSIYQIEIFSDHDGESFNKIMLNNEKDFVMCRDCRGHADTISNIIDHINFFSMDEINLDIKDKNNKFCYLKLLSRVKNNR